MEGTATYLSHYFHNQQPNARRDHLYGEMHRYLTTDYNDSGLGTLLDQYKDSGRKLYDFRYGGDDHIVAYGIGAWFIAYLVDQEGVEKIFELYANLEELGGFENSVAAIYGKTHIEYLDDFDVFLDKPQSEIMSLIPRWKRIIGIASDLNHDQQ